MSGEREEDSLLRVLLLAGYTPESAVAALSADDLSVLRHPGEHQVKLRPPGEPDEQEDL